MTTHPEITKEDIRRMKGCEKLCDELTEQIVFAIKRLCEIMYNVISQDQSLALNPSYTETKLFEEPKRKTHE